MSVVAGVGGVARLRESGCDEADWVRRGWLQWARMWTACLACLHETAHVQPLAGSVVVVAGVEAVVVGVAGTVEAVRPPTNCAKWAVPVAEGPVEATQARS